jgi:hypothetical protein
VGPGEAAWRSSKGGHVWDYAGEGFVSGDASTGLGRNKAEAGLGLGATVHVSVGKHEVEVGSHGVGEGEGCEASDARLGVVQLRGVGRCRDEGVTVEGGVGSDVGIQNVVGAASDHPGGVEVTAKALEGHVGDECEKVFAKEIDGVGEILCRFVGSEGEEWI